jgi:hypothetical protein
MATASPRGLIWFPIVHAQADLGTMGKTVRHLQIQKMGRPGWEKHRKVIDEMWTAVRRHVVELDLPWERVRLYQDGLANCGHERECIRNLGVAVTGDLVTIRGAPSYYAKQLALLAVQEALGVGLRVHCAGN